MKRELGRSGEDEKNVERQEKKRKSETLTTLPVDRTALVAVENWQTSSLNE